ncbi:hypothetical protein Hanom_Chr08g00691301 [Helianthus anomalus]
MFFNEVANLVSFHVFVIYVEQVIYDLKGDVIMCDPEDEMNVFNGEKMSKSQQLYLMWELLPVMTKTTKKRSSSWIPKLKTQV